MLCGAATYPVSRQTFIDLYTDGLIASIASSWEQKQRELQPKKIKEK